ncbi:N-acetylmuramoyl-L-alanine amidase [Actinobacillus minor]|uniref:N-acetylmuramoyl-L-alanine amidase n=1 Tax=Actinobacillus minor TaxID=51047 RepID=UPI0023F4F552|nr:N-acetylmuramoyl-L-alanine amidase [Actinobacillus minor]MDD6910812.1 N-acetylmuramoyl-L-alanine amidase [Actinobacillus minor]MDY4713599.1 N-acetylmuramoyl-L-alanine amidase [Actinobacillus minor]
MKKVIRYFLVSLFGLMLSSLGQARTVVVIDAGHGGKDPGAIGKKLGIKEKEVTLSISKELKALLDADPNFKAVMTRNSDVFIQLPERTEIARKNKANYLVSIHADSSPISSEIKGASVWVLSNQRASDEMGKWLEESEKQSELLGGAGRILSNNNERYLNQTVLDLQFSHSQRAGYELGKTVLARMANMTTLAKSAPQHASLSVLRSPDITSILVETGFLSNPIEEKKLATASYRKQLAKAIYNGLVAYRNSHVNISESRTSNVKVKEVKESKKDKGKKEDTSKDESKKPVKEASAKEKKSTKAENAKDIERKSKEKNEVKKEEKSERKQPQKSNTGYHIVQQDETLYSIARVYGTTPEKLSQLNNIKNNQIIVGKKLKIQ